ncbi:MAG TPA: hypothetical protein DCM08_05870, partial [Microscillaceae bacterium]|nr:hypothetical protein [Microscillaceae bacterium]
MYRFSLLINNVETTIETPVNWRELSMTLKRDPQMKGVFSRYSLGKVRLVDEGRSLVYARY